MIIIDTREQKPIKFDKSIRQTLVVGDYTTKKHFNKLHIERKSPGDLYGTLLKGHKRFRKELLRAIKLNIKLVVVIECSAEKFLNKEWDGAKYCKVDSETVLKIVKAVSKKYAVKFVWCNNRVAMKKKIINLLK